MIHHINYNNAMDMKELKVVHDKFIQGREGLEDFELDNLIEYYRLLETLTNVLGAEYGLMKRDIRLKLECLKNFEQARKHY